VCHWLHQYKDWANAFSNEHWQSQWHTSAVTSFRTI
jgi:hypothetical protein